MSLAGAEALKAAIRRSLPIIGVLLLLGLIGANVFARISGARYQAASRVEISSTPLSSIITGTEPPFVDPQRVQDSAQALASSIDVYQLVAQQTHGRYGSASDLQSITTVTEVPDTDILSFTVTTPDPRRAVAIANAVADGYSTFRAQLSGAAITQTAGKLQHLLSTLAANSAQGAAAQAQLNRLQLLQQVNSSDAVVIQRAITAAKIAPAPAKDSLLGLAIGLVIALLAVALREAIDTSVRSESDVEQALGVPVLAKIRTIPRKSRLVSYGRQAETFGDAFALLAAQLSNHLGSNAVLAITSALPREGKTTTAANLAVTAARRGARVLLADFDWHRAALSALFEVPPDAPGALDFLRGEHSLDDLLWSVSLDTTRPVLRRTSGERLREPVLVGGSAIGDRDPGEASSAARGELMLLPSGGTVAPEGAASESNLSLLVSEMSSRAELVIVDTPPALLTVEMTELAELIDGVLVVVRQGQVSERALISLSRQARSWSANLIGSVLTGVPANTEYGAYYGTR